MSRNTIYENQNLNAIIKYFQALRLAANTLSILKEAFIALGTEQRLLPNTLPATVQIKSPQQPIKYKFTY